MADASQDMLDFLSQFDLPEDMFEESQKNPMMMKFLENEMDGDNGSPWGSSQGSPLKDDGFLGMTQYQLWVERDRLHSTDPQFVSSDPEISVQVQKRKRQNCTAARKYRAKKKEEEKSLKDNMAELRAKNVALIREKDQLKAELKYMRQVLKDHASCLVFKAPAERSQQAT